MNKVIELGTCICVSGTRMHVIGEQHIRIETSSMGGGVQFSLDDPAVWTDHEYLVK